MFRCLASAASVALAGALAAGAAAQEHRPSALSETRRLIQAGQLEQARAIIEAALAQEPESAQARYLLGSLN